MLILQLSKFDFFIPGSNISSQNEKNEDKLVESSSIVAPANATNATNIGSKSPIGGSSSAATGSDIAKDVKEEAAIVKD